MSHKRAATNRSATALPWHLTLATLFALVFTSCGGTSSSSTSATQPGASTSRAYVSNYGSGAGQTLTGYSISSTNGNLLGFDLSVIKVPTGPTSLTSDGTGKYLYVGNQGGVISGYSINAATGSLTELASSPYGAGSQVNFLTVDTSGKYLFSVDNLLSTVWPFTITAGVLSAVAPTGTVPSYGVTPAPPVSATVDPLLRNLYVPMGAAGTEVFAINKGALLDVAAVPPTSGAGSQFVAIERTGRFTYIADGVSGVSIYFIDPTTGNLGLMTALPIATGSHPARITLTPDSRYLYVANQGDGTVAQFAVSSGGGLVSIGANLMAGNQPVTHVHRSRRNVSLRSEPGIGHRCDFSHQCN